MTTTMEAKKKRTEMLVEMRKEHRDTVQKAQELLKAQQSTRKALERALTSGPHSVPQLAQAVDMPAHEVLWHIAAMKKYGIVAEAGTDESGDYYLYRLTKEAQV
jgi:predicted ArsR family transcriptional regulator